RHAPDLAADRAVQGSWARRRRRRAALRGGTQGVPEVLAHSRRCPDAIGDTDPEDARDVAHRDPRDDDNPHPARGTPPDPDVCGYPGSAADRRGDSPRAVT